MAQSDMITFTVTQQQATIVLGALGDQRWVAVNDLIVELRGQAQRQVDAAKQQNVTEFRPAAGE